MELISDNRYGKNQLIYLYELIFEGNHPHEHLVESQYVTSFYYYTNLLCTVFFVLTHPLLELSLFDQYNGWNAWTMVWSFSLMFLCIYSIFMIVGSEVVQVIALTPVVYIKGLTLMHILLNVAMWFTNTAFWVDSTEFETTEYQRNAMTIEQWMLVTIWPNFIFLFFFWLFIVDVDNYYVNYASPFQQDWPTLFLSTYTKWIEDNTSNLLN